MFLGTWKYNLDDASCYDKKKKLRTCSSFGFFAYCPAASSRLDCYGVCSFRWLFYTIRNRAEVFFFFSIYFLFPPMRRAIAAAT